MASSRRTGYFMGNTEVIARVEGVLTAAAEHLKLPTLDMVPAALGRQLHDLSQLLEQRIAGAVDPDERSRSGALLITILKSRCELLDNDLARRVEPLSEARRALAELRGLSPGAMIQAAPGVLSRQLGFTRTMISAVRGSWWLPRHLHIEDGADRHTRGFRAYVDSAQIPLGAAPLETELVRKRSGAFVPSPADDKRTFKEIVTITGSFGYIAAPITVHGRTIGLLHADRPEPHGVVTMDHLDQLEAFAECLSVAFESAVLGEKAARQRIEIDNLHANFEGLLGGEVGPSQVPASAVQRGHRDARRCFPMPADRVSLTAREQEIMAHVAAGATNGQIARSLVISEGTVKSHLKRIAKKLNTPSRAAAVAVYSGMAGGNSGVLL